MLCAHTRCLDFAFSMLIFNVKILQLNGNDFELGSMMEKLDGKTVIEKGVQQGLFVYELLSRLPSFKAYFGVDSRKMQSNNIDVADQLYEVTQELIL